MGGSAHVSSSLNWLDRSEAQRRKMLDVIGLFRDPGTLDELGIGSVRDAFADMLFPATSTIQTRARYFFFVPWIYRRLEAKRVPSAQIADRARREEIRLIKSLQAGGDTQGLIGNYAGSSLQRLPSTVYWNGLKTLGIRLFTGSQPDYHRSLDGLYRRRRRASVPDDDEPVALWRENWDPGIPEAPDDLFEEAGFELSLEEAEYLQERILATVGDSLLGHLVATSHPGAEARLPWEHPDQERFPDHIREQLEHARNFSEAMWGAALLYNLLLARKLEWEERIEHYEGLLADWRDLMTARSRDFERWDRRRFWFLAREANPRVPAPTVAFVDRWLDRGLADPGAVQDDAQLHKLLEDRELRLKGRRARLSNREAREDWSGASGADQLDYRWAATSLIVEDILHGLRRKEAAVARA